ncbi:hypothetical protein F5878DRAFT_369689 [Lentinula raphanica]|uniref:Uncharacterized protein n=1 Tax=Lentinula raphanica TaxID=153919 RepID=A0AA38PGU9_9AGAR|nr:hypothetical protein F5878DRAFT_369689 [Lentinula raphanica]
MLPEEIQFVWTKKRRLRPFDILYLAQRYMPFIDTVLITSIATLATRPMDPDTCRVLVDIAAWMDLIGIALTEVVLTIRTWVLWKKDIKLSFGLPLFYICCWMPIFYGLNQFLQSLIFIPSPIPQVSGCAYLGGQKIFYICWVFLAVYEVGMLILMFIPGFRLCTSFFLCNAQCVCTDGYTF